MKFNLKSLAMGSVAAIALISAPLAMTSSARPGGPGHMREAFEQLDLTDAQSDQIEAIFTDARAQVGEVLDAEQQATLEAAMENGRRAWRELDLSDEQRDQLRSIREASREEVKEVLTAEQLEQLEDMRAQRGNRRGGRR